jgi:predicted ATPase
MDTRAASASEQVGRLVVLTGGPGAGKTAVLEVVRRHLWEHVAVLPESASIVFGGGFPRKSTVAGRRAAQRAIYSVQRQLERLAIEEGEARVVLCDRGTLDGVAYWPLGDATFYAENGTERAQELTRYAAVIHLRTPTAGYNHQNPLRVESVQEAAAIDERIARAWDGHPRRLFVESTDGFMEKVERAIALIRSEVSAGLACAPPAP